MKKLPLLLMLLISLETISQQFSQVKHQNPMAEDMDHLPPLVLKSCPPKFPGDEYALNDFVSKNAKFPKRAFNEKIEGNVVVEVNISKKGSIEILKVIGRLGGGCEQEAVRIVNLMPCWQPALQNGEAIECKMRIPVRFELK